jgi:hypothetical protein
MMTLAAAGALQSQARPPFARTLVMFKIERSILLCMGAGSDDHDTFVRKKATTEYCSFYIFTVATP